jgi:BlaI family transcriptional regulator, penicillinase repressor
MARTTNKEKDIYLSPREQQIMEIIYRSNRGVSATEVMEGLPHDLSNSAVRTFLRILEHKGHLKHDEKEGRYIYKPTRSRDKAAHAATRKLLMTFFDGSVAKAVKGLLSDEETSLSAAELDEIAAFVAEARKSAA